MSITSERIKLRLKETKKTVDDIAPIIGKNRATVYRYLNGSIDNIPIKTLSEIAAELHTTPDYLMGWTDDPFGKETFDHATDRIAAEYNNMIHHLHMAGFTDEEIEYVDKYHTLDETDKDIINQIIDKYYQSTVK